METYGKSSARLIVAGRQIEECRQATAGVGLVGEPDRRRAPSRLGSVGVPQPRRTPSEVVLLGEREQLLVDELDDAPAPWSTDRGTTDEPLLEQRAVEALEELRAATDTLGPQAAAWRDALRDVHAYLYDERSSECGPMNGSDLVLAYQRLYDELRYLSMLFDPGVSRREPEVPG